MKFKCMKCGDIIEGDNKGHLVWCKCGNCFIDETEYYYRVEWNEGNSIIEIKEDGIEVEHERSSRCINKFKIK